jgi:E3 ubiquitin-protein ligase TRIP12
METYGYKKSILEFEVIEEEGTGLGPTLEYYALVANEFKNPRHNLWRSTDSNMLFPTPIDPYDLRATEANGPQRRKPNPDRKRDFEKFQLIFRCAGTMIARSILDDRMIDLPIHPVLWKIILNRPLFLDEIVHVDKSIGDTLLGL